MELSYLGSLEYRTSKCLYLCKALKFKNHDLFHNVKRTNEASLDLYVMKTIF